MKAIKFHEPTGPQVLRYEDMPMPVLRLPVDRAFPLGEAQAVESYLKFASQFGRVVLEVYVCTAAPVDGR